MEQGDKNPELRARIEELASRLGEDTSGEEAESETSTETLEPEVAQAPPALSDGERFEERIDSIFHFLLGDSPEHDETDSSGGEVQAAAASGKSAQDGGSGDFVDLLEDWIDDIRQGT